MSETPLEIEVTWEEILGQSERFAGRTVRVTILSDNPAKTPEESLIQALQEVREGKVRPIAELWDGIDVKGF